MELLEEFLVDFIGLLALALLVMPFFLPADQPGDDDQPDRGDPPDQPGGGNCRTCKYFIPLTQTSTVGRCVFLIKKGILHAVTTR